jgi:hypothetical protein
MVTPVRIAAAAAMCLGVAACANTTDGSAATTTEPADTPASAAPAPSNVMTMTCAEFTTLDQPVRLEVVRTILDEQGGAPGQPTPEMAEGMANAICQALPDQTVHGVLTGAPPP